MNPPDQFEDALEETADVKENVNSKPVDNTTVNSTNGPPNDLTNDSTDNSTNKTVLNEIKDNKTNTLANAVKTTVDKDEIKKPIDAISNSESRLKEMLSEFRVYTMEDGIDKCIQSAFELNVEFFKDEFEFVLLFCEQNYNKNVWYSLIYGAMYFIKTWMSFEQPEIQKCLEILNRCSEYVNSRRRVYGWSDLVKKVNYNEGFTDGKRLF